MVSRKKMMYGVVGLFVVVGIILVVLGAMGYLSPKRGSGIPGGPLSPSWLPNPAFKDEVITFTDYDQKTGTFKYNLLNPSEEQYPFTVTFTVNCSGNCNDIPSSALYPSYIHKSLTPPSKSGSYSYTDSDFIIHTTDAQRTANVVVQAAGNPFNFPLY